MDSYDSGIKSASIATPKRVTRPAPKGGRARKRNTLTLEESNLPRRFKRKMPDEKEIININSGGATKYN
uniref:Uncharacterized protein n=1 Tax=Rhodnius prolixus TaxID=13249 RepID=T1HR98_RHOPR